MGPLATVACVLIYACADGRREANSKETDGHRPLSSRHGAQQLEVVGPLSARASAGQSAGEARAVGGRA
eukprot:15446844-Alexandrium_andersonii.AAC.1